MMFSAPTAFFFPEGLDFEGGDKFVAFLVDRGHTKDVFLKKASSGYCVLSMAAFQEYRKARTSDHPVSSAPAAAGGLSQGGKSRRAELLKIVQAHSAPESLGQKAESMGLTVVSLERFKVEMDTVLMKEKEASRDGRGTRLGDPFKWRCGFTDATTKPRIVIEDMLGFYPRIERVSAMAGETARCCAAPRLASVLIILQPFLLLFFRK